MVGLDCARPDMTNTRQFRQSYHAKLSRRNLWWRLGRDVARRFPGLKLLMQKLLCTLSILLVRRYPGRRVFTIGLPTVVLCVHEATRTGAPIVGLNLAEQLSKDMNVICVLLRGGELLDCFENWTTETFAPAAGSLQFALARIFAERVLRPIGRRALVEVVLVNGANSAVAVDAAKSLGLANVCLVHEFAQSLMPQYARKLMMNADRLVFSSNIQRQSFVAAETSFLAKSVILPQGKCTVPQRCKVQVDSSALELEIERNKQDESFFCIGCGHVQPRKGVDLFIATAAKLKDLRVPARFLWVGDGFLPPSDPLFSLQLEEQIVTNDLVDIVAIVPAVGGEALERLYGEADAMFLSSRIDPLPNVAIDAMYAGLPVVCFDGATGIAEMFAADDLLRRLVAPYCDIHAAAETLAMLSRDANFCGKIGSRLSDIAAERFDMNRYVTEVERVMRSAATPKGA